MDCAWLIIPELLQEGITICLQLCQRVMECGGRVLDLVMGLGEGLTLPLQPIKSMRMRAGLRGPIIVIMEEV